MGSLSDVLCRQTQPECVLPSFILFSGVGVCTTLSSTNELTLNKSSVASLKYGNIWNRRISENPYLKAPNLLPYFSHPGLSSSRVILACDASRLRSASPYSANPRKTSFACRS